jgi:hypothetical protein
MLLALQLEHWREQPRQVLLGVRVKPWLQVMQAEEEEQLKQFLGQG